MRRTIVTAAFLLCSISALAENWIPLGKGSQMPPLSVLSIDQDSIVRNGNTVTLWMRYQNHSTDTIFQSNDTYDCKQRTLSENSKFQLGWTDMKRYEMQPKRDATAIVPGWGSEVVFNFVCSKKFYEFWKP